MLDPGFIETLLLTLKLAGLTSLVLLLIALPLSFFITQYDFRLKPFFETIITMPLVLPPTVLGYYLLLAMGSESMIGRFFEDYLGLSLAFSFEGILIGSVIYSLPFMVYPIQGGIRNLPDNLKEASYTLGKSKLQTYLKVLLPNIKPSILTGLLLSFTHTIGEFGVVLMIGGNIPGKTRVASIAIYDEVEALNYSVASNYAWILLVFSFIMVLSIYLLNGKFVTKDLTNDRNQNS